MSFYLVLVGTVDNPIYETTLLSTRAPPSAAAAQASLSSPSQQSFSIFGSPSAPPSASGKSAVSYGPKHGRHVMQLVAHASLDVVEDVQWVNGYMCLKSIDKFHEWTVSAWVTPGGLRIILLHDLKQDDSIRLFLHAVWEAYTKHLLNPFHELNAPIRSTAFDTRVKAAAKQHL